jgi:DNA polymerase III sliding clamp (beta) subunit (PCNA family)
MSSLGMFFSISHALDAASFKVARGIRASKSCEIEKNIPKVDIRDGVVSISNGTGGLHSFADALTPPGFEIQFNAKYLLETLATLRGLVTVSVKAPLAAVLFNPKDAREVRILMPLNPGK